MAFLLRKGSLSSLGQKLKPKTTTTFPETKTTFSLEVDRKGKLKPKTKTMVLVLAMAWVKGILTFFCASFFLFSPGQYSSPNPLFLGPQIHFLVEKRQPTRAGFWGQFWTGSPHRK